MNAREGDLGVVSLGVVLNPGLGGITWVVSIDRKRGGPWLSPGIVRAEQRESEEWSGRSWRLPV